MPIVSLTLLIDGEKCFVFAVRFRDQAAFTLSKASFVTRTVDTQYHVAKLRLKTSSNSLVAVPRFETLQLLVLARSFTPGCEYSYKFTCFQSKSKFKTQFFFFPNQSFQTILFEAIPSVLHPVEV